MWPFKPKNEKKPGAGKYKNMFGPSYKVVNWPDSLNRTPAMTEMQDEDAYLNWSRRGRMLDLARNSVRNSATFNSILKQFDLHAVGVDGGKAIVEFEDVRLTQKTKDLFIEWTRNAEFFDGADFNQVLRLILKTFILGGDEVLLFDDGLVEDSGRLLIYESDELGNTTEDALRSRYGKFARQSLGRVYNRYGRWIGAVVSRSQRGLPVFDPAKSYLLKRDPDASYLDCPWIMPRNVYRPNQGRGVSPIASVVGEIIDLEDLLNYEIQAAKKNAQIVGTVSQESEEDAVTPSAFGEGTDFENMTDDEIAAAAKEEAQAEHTMTLDVIRDAGAKYQVLPQGYRFDLLDTKRPNAQMAEFIKFMAGRTVSPFGLAQHFADNQITGGDYTAQMLFSKRAFQDVQKFLERICDWCFYNFVKWSVRRGYLENSQIFADHGFMHGVSWAWPEIESIDQNAWAQASATKLKYMTASYKDLLGVNWQEKLEQMNKELTWFKDHNIPHPVGEMISGGVRPELGGKTEPENAPEQPAN